jgi:hypothetical protein
MEAAEQLDAAECLTEVRPIQRQKQTVLEREKKRERGASG